MQRAVTIGGAVSSGQVDCYKLVLPAVDINTVPVLTIVRGKQSNVYDQPLAIFYPKNPKFKEWLAGTN